MSQWLYIIAKFFRIFSQHILGAGSQRLIYYIWTQHFLNNC